jgi:hypothetical protein
MKSLSLCAVLLSLTVVAAQEGGALPNAYRVQFENAWVRVTNVRYGALEKVPAHSHTPFPSAYVYLNDAGPVIFKHVGGHGTAAKRPATKAGAFRVYQGLEEIHEVENTTAVPSEFLRVELKTEGVSPATFRGKFERPAAGASANGEQVQFDHAQAAFSRITIAPGASWPVASTSSEPSLLIALAPGSLQAGETRATLANGQTLWLATPGDVKNVGSSAVELLRVRFKTRPR